jgi:hypothetical protein
MGRRASLKVSEREEEELRKYKSKIEALSRKNVCRGKEVKITYSECVSVTLVILQRMRIRPFIFSSVTCPAAQHLIIIIIIININ